MNDHLDTPACIPEKEPPVPIEKDATARPVVYYHATTTSRLPAEDAGLTAKCYRIFPIQVKYRSIKIIKPSYLYYNRR
jgi:hypothetical protein